MSPWVRSFIRLILILQHANKTTFWCTPHFKLKRNLLYGYRLRFITKIDVNLLGNANNVGRQIGDDERMVTSPKTFISLMLYTPPLMRWYPLLLLMTWAYFRGHLCFITLPSCVLYFFFQQPLRAIHVILLQIEILFSKSMVRPYLVSRNCTSMPHLIHYIHI